MSVHEVELDPIDLLRKFGEKDLGYLLMSVAHVPISGNSISGIVSPAMSQVYRRLRTVPRNIEVTGIAQFIYQGP